MKKLVQQEEPTSTSFNLKEEPQQTTEESTSKSKFVPEPNQDANHRAKYINMFKYINGWSDSQKRRNFNNCDSQNSNGPVQIVQVENDNSLSSNSSSSSNKPKEYHNLETYTEQRNSSSPSGCTGSGPCSCLDCFPYLGSEQKKAIGTPSAKCKKVQAQKNQEEIPVQRKDENLAIPGPSGLNRFNGFGTKRRIVHDSDSSDSDVAQNHFLFNSRMDAKRLELRQSDVKRTEPNAASEILSAPDLQLDCFSSSSDAEQSDSDSVIFVDEDKKVNFIEL